VGLPIVEPEKGRRVEGKEYTAPEKKNPLEGQKATLGPGRSQQAVRKKQGGGESYKGKSSRMVPEVFIIRAFKRGSGQVGGKSGGK